MQGYAGLDYIVIAKQTSIFIRSKMFWEADLNFQFFFFKKTFWLCLPSFLDFSLKIKEEKSFFPE